MVFTERLVRWQQQSSGVSPLWSSSSSSCWTSWCFCTSSHWTNNQQLFKFIIIIITHVHVDVWTLTCWHPNLTSCRSIIHLLAVFKLNLQWYPGDKHIRDIWNGSSNISLQTWALYTHCSNYIRLVWIIFNFCCVMLCKMGPCWKLMHKSQCRWQRLC